MALLEVVVSLLVAFPLPVLGGVWLVSARRARAGGSSWWVLGPFALLLTLYAQRRHVAGLAAVCAAVLLLGMWSAALLLSPAYRWGVGVAAPTAGLTWFWVTLIVRYPTLHPATAARVWWSARQYGDDLRPAVKAAAGERARVVRDSVRVLDDGSVVASVVGPPGVSHEDLVGSLRESLAESVLAISGRALRDVAVTGSGVKGRATVRCSTADPYSQSMTLREVLGR